MKSGDKEYAKIHQFLNINFLKQKVCSFCKEKGRKRYEWALLKGKEYSYNINDYIELCVPCHRKYDVTEEFKQNCSKRMKLKNIGIRFSKPIIKCDLNGNEICSYQSLKSACFGTMKSPNISMCLTGKNPTAYGFKWKYKNKIKNK